MRRLAPLALAVLLAAPALAAGPFQVQLFSGVDREAVEIGGLLEIDLEALAVPTSAPARAALVQAFGAWDVGEQLGDRFHVVRRGEPLMNVTGDVVELQRRVIVRVIVPTDAVPALRLDIGLGGRTWTHRTRAHPIWTFADDGPARVAARSVVSITAEGEVDGIAFERAGSAFAVGGDALVTAYHVVVGARRVRVRLPDGSEVKLGRVWALDPIRDVAVLHLPDGLAARAGLSPLVIAPPEAPGDLAVTAGWPGEVQRRTVTVRFDDLVLDAQRLRVAANPVRPGDSGGPMLDVQGRVLGVVVSGRPTGGTADLLATPIALASDPGPALAMYTSAEKPVRLHHALADAARSTAAARALEAVGALQVPARRADRRAQVVSLREAVGQTLDAPVIQYTAGMALVDAGEPALAAVALDVSRRAGYVPAAYSLAHHRMGRSDFHGAAELFAEVADEGPYRRLAAFGHAQALMHLGRYEDAERALRPVLDHDARFAPALYLLGIVRLSQGRAAEAHALAVRLAARPAWADALRIPLETAALRPPTLAALPRVTLR